MTLAVTRHTWVPGYDGRHLRSTPLRSPAGPPARTSISEEPDGLQNREMEETGGNPLLNPIPGGIREKAGGWPPRHQKVGRQDGAGGRTGPDRTPQPHGLVRIWDRYKK